jgi:hypothetical protein
LKGVECFVIHVQNKRGWEACRGFFGNVLLGSSPFDPVAFRHQGIANFGVKENIRHSHEHGFLVCRVYVVHPVLFGFSMFLVQEGIYLVEREIMSQ